MDATTETTMSLPATLDPADANFVLPAPALIIAEGGTDKIKAAIRELVAKAKGAKGNPTADTEDGRSALKSIAYNVARSKTAVDDWLSDHAEAARKTVKEVNAARKIIKEDLEALQDELKAPVIAWETAEASRVKRHEDALVEIEALIQFEGIPSADTLRARLGQFNARERRDWEEYYDRAAEIIAHVESVLTKALARQAAHEAEQAELAELRAERAKRLAQAEAERIRKEQEAADHAAAEKRKADIAAAAERAKIEAEQKAERDAEAAKAQAEAQLRAAEEKSRLEREAAVEAARKAAEALKAAEAKAEFEKAQSEERARQAEILAEKRRLEAVEQERQRAEREKLAKAAEDKRRQDDLDHRRTINNVVVAALKTHLGYIDEDAKELVEAIARGKISHVIIQY